MVLRLRVIPSASARDGGKAPIAEHAIDFDDGVGQIRIGRRPDLELSLPYSPLSGVHARLVRASDTDKKTDHWVLEDLGSTNGTYVGGERLKPGVKRPLTAGTQIKLAEIKVIFDGEVRPKLEATEVLPHVSAESSGKVAGKVSGEASSKATGKTVSEPSHRSTGKVQAEVPNRVTSRTQSEPGHRDTGKVQPLQAEKAEAPNRITGTGKVHSEVSSKPESKAPVPGAVASKSAVNVKAPEPTETYVRRQLTDVVAAAPSVAQVPYLTAVAGLEGKVTFRLEQRDHVYMFGRTRRCEFRVNISEVSREHASFTRRADGIYVNDLESVNGVLVNNTRVREYRLYDGDLIQIGHVKLRLFDPSEPSPREGDRSASSHSALSHSHSALSHSALSHSSTPSHSAFSRGAPQDATSIPAHEPASAYAEGSSTLHPAVAGALAAEDPGGGYRRRPSVRIRLTTTWEKSSRFRYVTVILCASLLAICAVIVGFTLAE